MMVYTGVSSLSSYGCVVHSRDMVPSLSPSVSISLYYLDSNPIPRQPKLTIFSTRQHKYRTPLAIQGSSSKSSTSNNTQNLKTCKNCKTQFDPLLNHPCACRFHTAHFGGETKRKFESVYSGGTMNTPNSGQVFQYWHCCGSDDPFDPGCTSAPHASYDD